MSYYVQDNVTGERLRSFEVEADAQWLCRGLNLGYGPGGRYSVRKDDE